MKNYYLFFMPGRLAFSLLVGLLGGLATYTASGQSVDLITGGAGTGTSTGLATATTPDGNVYVTGNFSGTATISGTQVVSAGSRDIFVAKYNAAGVLQWLRRAGGSDSEDGTSIAVDASGVYVTGAFNGTVSFDTPSSPASNTLTSVGDGDIFIAKYDGSGTLQWLRGAGGSDRDFGLGIAVDASGVYMTGGFSGTASFDTPSSPASNTLTSVGDEDIFIAKYDGSGTLQWLRRAGGSNNDTEYSDAGNGIAVYANAVYVTGYFSGTADFSTPSSPASNTLVSVGSKDIFVAKYDASGILQWLRRAGGVSSGDAGAEIGVNASGVYVTGNFFGTVDFNTPSSSGSNTLVTGSNDVNIFVAKYDTDGVVQWLRRAGPGYEYTGSSLALDATGVYVTGNFPGTANFNTPSSTTSNTLVAAGNYDIFVAKYDTDGSVQWLRRAGGTSFDSSHGLAVDDNGVYVTGYVQSTANFNTPSAFGSNELSVSGSSTYFLARFAPASPTLANFAASPATVCAGNTTTFTATVGNVTGAYDFTLTNGTSTTTGTSSSSALSQSWTAAGFGVQTFTLTVSNNGLVNSAVTSLTVGGVISNTAINYWGGCISTDWQTAGNWSKGTVPTVSEDVVILATAINQPALSGTASINSIELPANTTLTVGSNSTLAINGSRSINSITTGFHNSGQVRNSGNLLILENVSSPGTQAIRNQGIITNLTGANIVIDRSSTTAFANASGASFVNSGSLTIGATYGGSEGFISNGSATNEASGYMAIDRTSSRGVFNTSGSSFVNSGTLLIGGINSGANQAIQNQTSFSNLAGGLITIDRLKTTGVGIANTGGSFVNSGTVSMGSSATLGQDGIGNGASFSNTAEGLIAIDRVSFSGLSNSNNFVNSGTVTIGASGSVGYYSLFNASSGSGSFSNLACGTLNVHQAVYNSITLVNQGLMVVSTTMTHTNTGFTNQGVISYLQGNPIPNVTNEGIIALPLTICGQSPYSPVLQLSGSNTLTVGSSWFTDARQTSLAGSYSSNTLTPNLPGGTTFTLWFPVTDSGNSCGYTVPISVTVKATPSLTITAAPPGLTITQGQTVTLTASGADSYTWTGGTTGNTFTASPASTTGYSLTGINTTSGCTSVTSVTVTVNAIGCNAVIHVTESGSGLQDGSSWANSLPGTSLQLAIDRAATCGGGQVWVATGTYKPTSTTNRTVSFTMRNNVAIYGGFLGSEAVLTARPNPVLGQISSSTLSGEIGNPNSLTDNSEHIIFNPESLSLNSSAILKGFVLRNGYTEGGDGGAIHNEQGNSPTIQQCLFQNNYGSLGGAVYNKSNSPIITDCVFQSNTAVYGGGFFCQEGNTINLINCVFIQNHSEEGGGGVCNFEGSLTLTNCSFQRNTANYGGGVSTNEGFLTVTGCAFVSNSALIGGGGGIDSSDGEVTFENTTMQDNFAKTSGGGIVVDAAATLVALRNCLFRGNRSLVDGGGIAITTDVTIPILVINSSFVTNKSDELGGAISVKSQNSLTVVNGSFQGNEAGNNNAVSWGAVTDAEDAYLINCVEFGNTVGQAFYGNFRADYSLLASASYNDLLVSGSNNLTATVSPFASTTGTQLAACSPAINAGDPATTSALVGTTDLAGNARFYNASRIDMGAYEFQGVGAPASFTVLGSGTATCASSPMLTLSGSQTGVNYQLQRNGLNSGAAVTGTGSALSFGPQSLSGTYTVLATSTSGCTVVMATSATVVSGTVAASVSVTPGSGTLSCASPSVSLSAIGTGTVLWSTGATTPVISATVAGTYSVTLTNASGCRATASATVSGSVLTSVAVTADGPVGCGRATATITIQGSGASSYTLVGPSGFSAVNSTGVFMVTAGGSYTGLASQSGCVLSGVVTVSEGGIQPTASNFRASGVLGAGRCSVELLATATGTAFVVVGPGGYVFSNVYRTAGSRELVGFSVTKPGTYTLTVYSGSCSATYTVVVSGTVCP